MNELPKIGECFILTDRSWSICANCLRVDAIAGTWFFVSLLNRTGPDVGWQPVNSAFDLSKEPFLIVPNPPVA